MKQVVSILGFFAAISCANAQSWEPKAWQKYLIEQQVKADTLNNCYSIMAKHSIKSKKLDPAVLNFGTFYAPEPKGILQEMEEAEDWERIRRGEYESRNIIADFIGSAFVEILNGIFFR